jgi:hypothetical protein
MGAVMTVPFVKPAGRRAVTKMHLRRGRDHPARTGFSAPKDLGTSISQRSGVYSRARKAHNETMVSPLTIDRVRSDVGVLARAGVETGEFLDELDAAVERVVPHVSMCSSTTDPATLMITATYKFGDLASTVGGHDHEWGLLEYMHPEPSSIPLLAGRSEACVTMFNETGGDLVRSRRMREIVVPTFAYGDELRLAARSNGRFWGGLSIYRGSGPSAQAKSRSWSRCRNF